MCNIWHLTMITDTDTATAIDKSAAQYTVTHFICLVLWSKLISWGLLLLNYTVCLRFRIITNSYLHPLNLYLYRLPLYLLSSQPPNPKSTAHKIMDLPQYKFPTSRKIQLVNISNIWSGRYLVSMSCILCILWKLSRLLLYRDNKLKMKNQLSIRRLVDFFHLEILKLINRTICWNKSVPYPITRKFMRFWINWTQSKTNTSLAWRN